MSSKMDPKLQHQDVQRALALGRSGDAAALPELARLLQSPSAEVRRLAASAIGKLASAKVDPRAAVEQQLYQQEGNRLISLYPADKPRLDAVLRAKTALFGYHIEC